MPNIKSVVIVGGGFAGLNAAKRLGQRASGVNVTLVDRHNYHLFQPLLYQVATAGLNPGDIASPIRTELAHFSNVRVLLGEAKSVDLKSQRIYGEFDSISYDYLILACGAQHSYFGHEDWEPFAPGLKTLEQATEIRRRILNAFEQAELEAFRSGSVEQEAKLTFVVVGGGPTGVELAGALGELARFTLRSDFRFIDPKKTKIILIEAGPQILPTFEADLSEEATRVLKDLGVTVRTGVRVSRISRDEVQLGKEVIRATTILWAAGVQPSALNKQLTVRLDQKGRVIVGSDLSIPEYPEVFVIGDQACVSDRGVELPGLAPVALQEGKFAADQIIADLNGRARTAFHYMDKGQMATIGRRRAVAQSTKFRLTGFLAWMTWVMVHIYYLIGFKNRVVVLIEWLWAYLTYKRGAQLIVNKEWRSF